MKVSLILTINLILNGDKLSIQFPELGKVYSKKVKVIAEFRMAWSSINSKITVLKAMTKWTLEKFILSLFHPKLIYQHLEFT